VDVAAIVEGAVDAIRLASQSKNVSLGLTWGAGRSSIPLMAMGDYERLRQVFSNILGRRDRAGVLAARLRTIPSSRQLANA
jgi:signal transduction histidine kinase